MAVSAVPVTGYLRTARGDDAIMRPLLQGPEGGDGGAEPAEMAALETAAAEGTKETGVQSSSSSSRLNQDKIYQLLSEIESDSDSIGR